MRTQRVIILLWLVLLTHFTWPSTTWTENLVQTHLIHLQTTDAVRLSGILRQPHGSHPEAALLMVHGYGGNFYSGIMGFLPERLAARGLTTLALNMRDHDLGPKKNRFEENLHDITAGIDEMARRGFDHIYLYGHSMGTNRVLYYLAETREPRVNGLILSGPPGNLFQWNVKMFGLEAATSLLRRAQALVVEGKGNEWMLIDLGPLGKTLYTANHVVSLRGPETHSDPFSNIARTAKPILILHGLADRLADPTVSDNLKKNATNGNLVTVVKIDGADHRFRRHQEALEENIFRWLLKQLGQ